MKKIGFLLSVVAALCALPLSAAAYEWFVEPQPYLTFYAGAAEICDSHQEACWGMEYRPAARFYHVGPWFSIGRGKENEYYAAAGIFVDLRLGDHFAFTPSFGVGYYHEGEGIDLGYDMQFRSALEVSWLWGRGHRLGISLAHLSNGSLSDINPGTETLTLSYSFPLNVVFDHFRRNSAE